MADEGRGGLTPEALGVRDTIAAMAVIARTHGLRDFTLTLDGDDYDRLALELDPEARERATLSGVIRVLTCNGVTKVFEGGDE